MKGTPAGRTEAGGDCPAWRLLDTGAAGAAWNIALDRAQLELRGEGAIPDTVRFLNFSPPAALIGRHQTLAGEIRIVYCEEHGIEVNRRITGGGAVYIDGSQLCWEVITTRAALARLGAAARLQDVTSLICGGVASGLRTLGVEASFRPRNDIEVDGRKIAGTGGVYEGDAILFQGTLLIDPDLAAMFRALRVPTEKLAAHELDAAADRVAGLALLLPDGTGTDAVRQAVAGGLAAALGVDLVPGRLTAAEQERLGSLLPQYASPEWANEVEEPADAALRLSAAYRGEGGLVRAVAALDGKRRLIKSVLFTGDFFVSPARAVFDLEAALKDVRFDEAPGVIAEFFTRESPETVSLGADDFSQALAGCLDKCAYAELGIPLEQADAISLIGSRSLTDTAARATVLLLPYCAKLAACSLRHADGCVECGDCSVGEAYGLAAAYGLRPATVQDYGQLRRILSSCREGGDTAFIGCCCRAFLAKRYRTFSDSGMAGCLIDINDTTCYDLKQEEEAYAGRFENQTTLRLDLLESILKIGATHRGETLSGGMRRVVT